MSRYSYNVNFFNMTSVSQPVCKNFNAIKFILASNLAVLQQPLPYRIVYLYMYLFNIGYHQNLQPSKKEIEEAII